MVRGELGLDWIGMDWARGPGGRAVGVRRVDGFERRSCSGEGLGLLAAQVMVKMTGLRLCFLKDWWNQSV